jgi:signal transduction histidine kinase
LNRLFQPFSRLHPPKDGLPLGPGLGLFISRSIVMRHGGSIWGRNREPGPGSEFGFTLPRVT